MGYNPNKLRLKEFYRYIERVFSFQQHIKTLNDTRVAAEIETEAMFEALFIGLLLRLGSFRALEFEMATPRVRKVLRHRQTGSINTLRYGLEFFEIDPLNEMLVSVMKQAKRSKMIADTICGFHVAAIDGTEYFRSAAIHCPHCMEIHLNCEQTHYVHRAVLLQHVGAKLKPFIAAEPIGKADPCLGDSEAGHEGELTAAKRLLERVVKNCGRRLIDLLTCDALYMNYPFARHCWDLGVYIVARVKDERTELYREIEALSALVSPIKTYDRDTGVVSIIYSIPDLHFSLDWDIPLHGLKVIETDALGTRTFLCATTQPNPQPDLIRQIVHLKWGVENNGIKDLKDNWHLQHNFVHHPTATWVIVLTLLIAYNLFWAYALRHLKTKRIYHLTQAQIVREFFFSYLSLDYPFPWARWVIDP